MNPERDHRRQGGASTTLLVSRGAAAIATVAGFWVLAAPFVIFGSDAANHVGPLTNGLTIGTVVVAAAVVRAIHPKVARTLGFVTAAAGAWLVVAPFLLSYASGAMRMSDVAAGTVLLVASVAGLVSAGKADTPTEAGRRPMGGPQERSRQGVALAIVLSAAAVLAVVVAVANLT